MTLFVCHSKNRLSWSYKSIVAFVLVLMSISISVRPVIARNASFTWIANNDSLPIDGYRLYYKTGDPGTSLSEYDGVDAAGGNPSPVEIMGQGSDSYTLPNLLENSSYSFILTSYRGTDESEPTTALTLAANSQPENTRSTSFSWLANEDDPPAEGYYLYYKTGDPGNSLTDYSGVDAAGGNPSPVKITGQGITSYTLNNLVKTESYSFVLTAYRGGVESQPTAAITLSTSNSPPVALNSTVSISEGQHYTGQLSANDPEGDALEYSLVSNCSKGNATITNSSNGTFTYIPNPGQSGSDVFTFLVSDGELDSALASVNISIADVNNPPSATGATINVVEDTTYNGQLTAHDPDGDSVTFSLATGGSKGAVTLINPATGAFTYEPHENSNGSDSFRFIVSDGSSQSSPATVNVAISAVNDAPVAESADITVEEDGQYNGVLSASDVDGDSLTYSLASGSEKGTVIITNSATGAFTYSPDANASGSDSFSFKANDGSLNSENGEVRITINGVNDSPVAIAAAFSLDEDTSYSGQLAGTDSDGDTLTYTITGNGSFGEAIITNPTDGSFIYTPDSDVHGEDSFTFAVNDGTTTSVEATVSVMISAVNDAPIANGLSVNTIEDTSYTGQLTASDPDGDTLTYSVVINPTEGTVAINNPQTGTFTYTPNGGATGSDSFSFTVSDGLTDAPAAVVNVNVYDANTKISVFGDASDSDYPGTMEDTFANLNTEINSEAETLNLYSWSASNSHRVANTILVKVDLSAIPEYATIVDAQLQLYMSTGHGATDYLTSVHQVTGKNPILSQVHGYNAFNGEPWTPVPACMTHNDIPMGLADIDSSADSVVVTPESGYITWSVTDMVQEWVRDSETNRGMLIQGEDNPTETGRYFLSSESQSADLRPRLILHYTTTPPPPQLIMVEEIR